MKSIFETIGFKLGQKAAQAKNAFDLMGGSDEESLRAEVRLGRDMADAVLQRTPLVEENDLTRFASQVGRWLAGHVRERKLPFSFHITAEREANALALPGGPIFVSWPLLDLCQGDRDQLAFLLGHEMAHVVLRHTLDRIVKDAAVSLLLKQASGRLAAGNWLRQVGQSALTRAFALETELEADRYANSLLLQAGGDAAGAETFLQRIARPAKGLAVALSGNYLATHPHPARRLANLRNSAPESNPPPEAAGQP